MHHEYNFKLLFCLYGGLYLSEKTEPAGVAAGLAGGMMLLWNYLIAPVYMEYPREEIIKLLPTVFFAV